MTHRRVLKGSSAAETAREVETQKPEHVAQRLQNTLSLLRDRLQEMAAETAGQSAPVDSRAVRLEALSLLALLKRGNEFRGAYDGRRLSDRKPLSEGQAMDVAELQAGVPLTRHSWLEELRNEAAEQGMPRPDSRRVFKAMLSRIRDMSAMPERDIEREHATVEMGFRFSSSVDYDGNPFSFLHVRASEAFELQRTGKGHEVTHVISDIRGIGMIYSCYVFGEDLGFTDDTNKSRWFYSSRADSISVDIPFDAITELPTDCSHGSLLEYRPGAIGMNTSDYHETTVRDTLVS